MSNIEYFSPMCFQTCNIRMSQKCGKLHVTFSTKRYSYNYFIEKCYFLF